MALADLPLRRFVRVHLARLPVRQVLLSFLALGKLPFVLRVQDLPQLRVQEVQLVRHGAMALSDLHRLSDSEFATLPGAKEPIELLLLHLLSMGAVKEDASISLAAKGDLERFITLFL